MPPRRRPDPILYDPLPELDGTETSFGPFGDCWMLLTFTGC